MISWLLTELAGKTGLIVAGVTLILGAIGTMLGYARKAGKDAQKVKEADAYEKHLQDIQNAAAARPSGSVSNDPNNRDNQKG